MWPRDDSDSGRIGSMFSQPKADSRGSPWPGAAHPWPHTTVIQRRHLAYLHVSGSEEICTAQSVQGVHTHRTEH